ncbi:hypothetical protein EII17_07220 [Clostridiales bacterium COT073_COT-073]|nr:hypothetical protein EII17_07220 [Clostridiales bacterium COT073_COT-073]
MEPILVGIWSLTLALLVIAIWYSQRTKKIKIRKKAEFVYPSNLRLYYFLLRFSYTRSLVLRCQYSLKQLTRLREEKLFNQVGDFFRKLILCFFLILGGLLLITGNIVYLGMYLFVTLVLLEVVIDYILVKRHNRLLKGQILFNELVRQKYHEQGTVEEAIYEACQEFPDKDSPMLIQGEYLYEVLLESNVEEAVQIYNQQAPNKYLKMLLNLCYITAEYGDGQKNGQSVFMNSLSHLTNELRVEEMKRERLNYSLKSLHVIAVLPLLWMLPLQNWATTNFEPLRIFYQSRWGKISEITMFCLILSAVMLLRKIQNIGILAEPTAKQKTAVQLADNKRKIRIFSFGIGLLLVLTVNWQEHRYLEEHSVLENGLLFIENSQEYQRLWRQKEKEWLSKLNPEMSKTEALTFLREQAGQLPELDRFQPHHPDFYVQRLYDKYLQLQKPWLGLEQVLILAVLAFALGYSYRLSDWLVRAVREAEREDEVAGYRSILLMLMYHSRLGTEEILTWLNMFSDYYTEQFERCLNNLTMGTEAAFAELKTAKHSDFQTLVLQLEAASKDLSLQQAFDDLAHEKAYYLEKRKEINRQMIVKRLVMGEIIGFLPAYALILLYLIIPMIYSGMASLNQFYQGI